MYTCFRCFSSAQKLEVYPFVQELLGIFPNSVYYSRRGYPVKAICDSAIRNEYTDVMFLHEDGGVLNSVMLVHLPHGPTATFKLSNVIMPKEIPNHAKASNHRPEVILNHFDTRLGHRIGRMLGALFDQEPNFNGRRVVTFHNQRDFVFFRHHRYIFADAKTAKLQECGPRFTLKLQSLQIGLPDSKHAEFEFTPKVWESEQHCNRYRSFSGAPLRILIFYCSSLSSTFCSICTERARQLGERFLLVKNQMNIRRRNFCDFILHWSCTHIHDAALKS